MTGTVTGPAPGHDDLSFEDRSSQPAVAEFRGQVVSDPAYLPTGRPGRPERKGLFLHRIGRRHVFRVHVPDTRQARWRSAGP
jgi:hypothetical protein